MLFVKKIFLIVLFLSGLSCSECKEDPALKANFQTCFDIIDLIFNKGYYSDFGTRMHAFECLIAVTGYEGHVDLFANTPATYPQPEYLDEDLEVWKQWYEDNKCSFTLEKANSLIERYKEEIGAPELTWPVRDSVTLDLSPYVYLSTNDEPAIAKLLIDSLLETGLTELLETTQDRPEFKSPSLRHSCFVVEFKIDSGTKPLFFSDSVVFITHKVCDRIYPLNGYKGVLSINNNHVAIFDSCDMGGMFYNADSLKMIPFSEVECYSLKSVPVLTYYIKSNVLNYWNP